MSEIIIETRHLARQYGVQKGVSDLNLYVRGGRIYGLLGRNGAGKTTTMKVLLRPTPPSAGEVILWGKALRGNGKRVLPGIGSIVESPGLYPNLAGTENLHIFATLRGIPGASAIQDALAFVELPYRDEKLFSQYSLSMEQRLALTLAVIHDPGFLIFDEPINELDPIGIAKVKTFIRGLSGKKEETVLLSSHILSEIALLTDDIGIIDQEVLLEEGSFEELEQKSNRYIHFIVSDTASAVLLLENVSQGTHYTVQDSHHIILYNLELPVEGIISTYVESGLEVFKTYICEEALRDYFKHVTGDEGIA